MFGDYFTVLKSRGGLKYPSKSLFDLIDRHIEPAIDNHLKEGLFLGGAIESLILKFKPISVELVENLGCSNTVHKAPFIVEIISFYTSVRIFFYTRQFNKEKITVSAVCKKKIKEGKLQ
jgi:hypothetical protein